MTRLVIVCPHYVEKRPSVMYRGEPVDDCDSGLVIACEACAKKDWKKDELKPVCLRHMLETPIVVVIEPNDERYYTKDMPMESCHY